MIDIELIRTETDKVAANLKNRGVPAKKLTALVALDNKWRKQTLAVEEIRSQQNKLNKEIAHASKTDREEIITELQKISVNLTQQSKLLTTLSKKRDSLWHSLPNLLLDDVPIGPDNSANKVLREVGAIPTFSFPPKEHWQLGADLCLIDSKTAAATTGSRFAYLKGELVNLQFALVQLALSVLTDKKALAEIAQNNNLSVSSKPFLPVIPPVMVRKEVLAKMSRLEPQEDRYHLPDDDLFLVGSAEHTLGPIHMDETLNIKQLPLRYVGYSTSFRRESGSYGKDVRGILRVHQFDKLEIESFTSPENSVTEQNLIVALQEHLLQQLQIPYRVIANASGDMAAPDARQIDIEAWLPGQNKYRETHTSDLMTDYQARKLNTKVKLADGSSVHVHMNDATVFAIGRTLIAIMENYQQENGSIKVPEKLLPYVTFKIIKRKKTYPQTG